MSSSAGSIDDPMLPARRRQLARMSPDETSISSAIAKSSRVRHADVEEQSAHVIVLSWGERLYRLAVWERGIVVL
jgi:hypothetical protein